MAGALPQGVDLEASLRNFVRQRDHLVAAIREAIGELDEGDGACLCCPFHKGQHAAGCPTAILQAALRAVGEV